MVTTNGDRPRREHTSECNLRGIRERHGLTQPQLAAKAEINKGHISLAENGRYRFTYDERLRIEMALGEQVKYFVKLEVD